MAEPVLISERAVELSVVGARTARLVAARLRAAGGFAEVVQGLASVTVVLDPLTQHPDEAARALREAAASPGTDEEADAATIELRVTYGGEDGPDLLGAAARLGLSEGALIARHAAPTYTAAMLGFTPGFAYLEGEDGFDLPRLPSPRLRVPAGSVGIAGARCGLYALAGPGGWPIIGRTQAPLFDAGREPPFLIEPGARVRFVPA